MRILQVRFKNLNSLAGEWAIDFTHPAFACDGIFAITGPTGAGKSTLLDAICLALYGQTPRLSKITKSGNEIMSRQTGECFAEVTFESQAGRFRCYWSQHRARKKASGDFQSPKHEVADADSGLILQSSLRGVAEHVEAVTGMDFERFTRSMLLAQGGFDSFLKADSDRRAPILEQITGTEIYSQISMRVHEMRTAERKKLDTLQAALEGIQLLSEEDEQQSRSILSQKIDEEVELTTLAVKTNESLAWLDGMASLEQALVLVETQRGDWQHRQDAFEPKHEKLKRASQALELAGEYAGLKSQRDEQQKDSGSLAQYLFSLPTQKAAVKRDEELVSRADLTLKESKSEQDNASIIIRKVRELDLNLDNNDAPIKAMAKAISEQERLEGKLRVKYGNVSEALSSKNEIHVDVSSSLIKTKVDEGLVENLEGMRNRFGALKKLYEQQATKAGEIKTTEALVNETYRTWQDNFDNLNTQDDGLRDIQKTLKNTQSELTITLEKRTLPDWRNDLSDFQERTRQIETVSQAVQSLDQFRANLDRLNDEVDALTNESTQFLDQIKNQEEKRTAFAAVVDLLETQLTLLNTIQSFDDARDQLHDGKDCPLCGSKEHPFAEGNIPQPDETALKLGREKDNLKIANDCVIDLKIKQTKTDNDLQRLDEKKKECSDRRAELDALIKQICVILSIDSSGENFIEELLSLAQKSRNDLSNSEKLIQSAERLEQSINTQRTLLEKTTKAVSTSEGETRDAAHQRDTALKTFERLKEEAARIDDQLQSAKNNVQQELSVYGIETLSSGKFDSIQENLITRRALWQQRSKEKIELEKAISSLGIQVEHLKEQLKSSVVEIEKSKDQLGCLQTEWDQLNRDRQNLFGGKNTDKEEARHIEIVNGAETKFETAKLALNTATQEQDKLNHSIDSLNKSIGERTSKLKGYETNFLAQLGDFNFEDESHYIAACLPEDERKGLMAQAQKLTNEHTELTSKARDKTALLEAERQKQLTEQSRDDISLVLADLETQQKELQQELGRIRQKLEDNERLKQTLQQRGKAIDAQKRESQRWDLLHELIGSADGKKFRNFAQGLTFEMMVGHANRQLQKMTDRYLLMRDEAKPLELNVVDNYQAGEVRSTKNLSGGESFIVSLSLALGLSQMASKNVRVDSLFLDEGFGTLDDEALETALDTLAGLQQDGKLIGVISHVSALKERIGTQIQINPQAGGRSVISGPGCGALPRP